MNERAKSHKELVEAAEKRLPPISEFITRPYYLRWAAVRQSYGDIRDGGKIGCGADITYAQAANLENEAFLNNAIDMAAPTRRRQVKRQRDGRLWAQDRRQRRRMLHVLKQPRSLIEARFLMEALTWLLAAEVPADRQSPSLPVSKSVNCVSDAAVERSKENDGRTPERRQHVFPSQSEELDLARRAKDGDPIARERLLAVHWPLVHGIAKKHAAESHPIEDLIGEGYLGLIRAFDKFDPEAGNRFSTFAMRPVEWAIQDYKRREQKKETVLLDASVENVVDLGNFNKATTRTSRIIRDAAARMTVHISPYRDGLAPETRDFIAELNAEAANTNIRVKYLGLANKIEAAGDIQGATNSNTLGGWLLRRAQNAGYSEGEEVVLRRGNSQRRAHLRKIAKRK